MLFFFFFFQAEDGIRDLTVTGVQTCALPIFARGRARSGSGAGRARLTLWAGRVEGRLAPEVWEFLRAHDAELLPYDCEGTLRHAGRLHAAGLLTSDELAEVEEILGGLDLSAIAAEDEDVHSAIERLLGNVGRKIHAGRSRNDQVAAALRLYVGDAC